MGITQDGTAGEQVYVPKFYSGRRWCMGHLLEVQSDKGQVIDRAVVKIGLDGHMSLERLKQIIPDIDKVTT